MYLLERLRKIDFPKAKIQKNNNQNKKVFYQMKIEDLFNGKSLEA